MEVFNGAKVVTLQSYHKMYLTAKDDEKQVTHEDRRGRVTRWTVEFVEGGNLIRLKSCFGTYLATSNEHFHLGVTGKKVRQSQPPVTEDNEWEPVKCNACIMLKTKYGTFLRANGNLPTYSNSVTHNVPQRASTQDWILWHVAIVEREDDDSSLSSQQNVASSSWSMEIELFNGAKVITLESHLKKYLFAKDDEVEVTQDRKGVAARWTVERVEGSLNLIRLKSCYGTYLTASNNNFLLGATGEKVIQSLPLVNGDSEWEPVTDDRDAFYVKLKTHHGTFLRANGLIWPYNGSVTHDVPHFANFQSWILWHIDVVERVVQTQDASSQDSEVQRVSFSNPSQASNFTYEELLVATDQFSPNNCIGKGGFAQVFKGILKNGKEVAVKKLKEDIKQEDSEFNSEVEIISRVHHVHLVSLIGYCITNQEGLLVYEYVSNKTLEFHLHGDQPTLDWPTRFRIALGSAKGLRYLHEECQPKIVHRDIKSSNILLDHDFQPKIADFGFAKPFLDTDTHVETRVVGSYGYLDPQYFSTGLLTIKSDIYSFGVMLLELMTGRRAVRKFDSETENLVQWARSRLIQALDYDNYDELVDPKLNKSYNFHELRQMVACATAAVRASSQHRPKMSQIVRALEGFMSLEELTNGLEFGESTVFYDTATEGSSILDQQTRSYNGSE